MSETLASEAARCRNCSLPLSGPYCGGCGQRHRREDRVHDLVVEWLQRVFGSEPILWRTIRRLCVSPAQLTHDWWEGRRAEHMSPVRTLLSVVVVASVMALVWTRATERQSHMAEVLMLAIYISAVATAAVGLRVLPVLLPGHLRRTPYEYATFALYEAAFQGLVAVALTGALVVCDLVSGWPIMPSPVAPLVVPAVIAILITHATVHLRGAFRLSWTGLALRMPVLAIGLVVAWTLTSIAFQILDIHALVFGPVDPPSSFRRVASPAA